MLGLLSAWRDIIFWIMIRIKWSYSKYETSNLKTLLINVKCKISCSVLFDLPQLHFIFKYVPICKTNFIKEKYKNKKILIQCARRSLKIYKNTKINKSTKTLKRKRKEKKCKINRMILKSLINTIEQCTLLPVSRLSKLNENMF